MPHQPGWHARAQLAHNSLFGMVQILQANVKVLSQKPPPPIPTQSKRKPLSVLPDANHKRCRSQERTRFWLQRFGWLWRRGVSQCVQQQQQRCWTKPPHSREGYRKDSRYIRYDQQNSTHPAHLEHKNTLIRGERRTVSCSTPGRRSSGGCRGCQTWGRRNASTAWRRPAPPPSSDARTCLRAKARGQMDSMDDQISQVRWMRLDPTRLEKLDVYI